MSSVQSVTLNTADYYLFDLCMDEKYLNSNWKKVVYFDTCEGQLRVNFHNQVSCYLSLNRSENNEEINQLPYTPHPELINKPVVLENIEERKIHLLFSATSNVQ